jgi:hypothetical protein
MALPFVSAFRPPADLAAHRFSGEQLPTNLAVAFVELLLAARVAESVTRVGDGDLELAGAFWIAAAVAQLQRVGLMPIEHGVNSSAWRCWNGNWKRVARCGAALFALLDLAAACGLPRSQRLTSGRDGEPATEMLPGARRRLVDNRGAPIE